MVINLATTNPQFMVKSVSCCYADDCALAVSCSGADIWSHVGGIVANSLHSLWASLTHYFLDLCGQLRYLILSSCKLLIVTNRVKVRQNQRFNSLFQLLRKQDFALAACFVMIGE